MGEYLVRFCSLALAVVRQPGCLLVHNLGAIYSSLARSVRPPILFGAELGHWPHMVSRLSARACTRFSYRLWADCRFWNHGALVVQHGALLGSRKGVLVILAVSLMTGGVAVCGWLAGCGAIETEVIASFGPGYYRSLFIAVPRGLLSSMFNHSFAFDRKLPALYPPWKFCAPRAYAVWPSLWLEDSFPFHYCVTFFIEREAGGRPCAPSGFSAVRRCRPDWADRSRCRNERRISEQAGRFRWLGRDSDVRHIVGNASGIAGEWALPAARIRPLGSVVSARNRFWELWLRQMRSR